MAGKVTVNQVQLGDSSTATNNFVWQTNADGTAKLARGNAGATTQDILTVAADGKVTIPQGAGATTTTSLTTGSISNTGNNTAVSYNGGQLAGLRNRIINGSMFINQRNGAALVSAGTSPTLAYNIDRWQTYRMGAVSGAFSQKDLTGLTGGPLYCATVWRLSGDTSTAAILLGTSLETGNVRDLQGKQVTMSFMLATVGGATTNGVIASIQQGTGTDGNLYTGFTSPSTVVASTALSSPTWTRYSITGTVATNATQLGVLFAWTPTGTAGATDYFAVTNVQLEVGSVATPFEERPSHLELMLCQRYYFKAAPSTAVQLNCAGYAPNANVAAYSTFTLPVPLRITTDFSASWTSGVNATAGTFRMADARTCEGYITSSAAGVFSAVANFAWFNAEI